MKGLGEGEWATGPIKLPLNTINDLLNAQGVYLIFVLKGRCLIDTRHLLEGGIYFLSKVMHSNHYRLL